MPVIDLPDWAILVANVGAYVLSAAVAGFVGARWPSGALAADGWLLRPRRWEADGRLYDRRLRIRHWKDRYPEAGTLFGGISKRRVRSGRAGLTEFAAETRRAELVHWWGATGTVPCLLWNPVSGWPVLALAALALHGVPIAIQRYNRQRIDRIVRRRSR